jgi:O-antigen ligase
MNTRDLREALEATRYWLEDLDTSSPWWRYTLCVALAIGGMTLLKGSLTNTALLQALVLGVACARLWELGRRLLRPLD